MEFSSTEIELLSLLESLSGQGRYCCSNAIHHLKKAWEIRTVDPQMAVFRAITADEEAASAVMWELRNIGYANSDKLNPHNHHHKNAVIVFLEVFRRFLFRFPDLINSETWIDIGEIVETKKPVLALRISKPSGEILTISPPLKFEILIDDETNNIFNVAPSFKAELNSFLSDEKENSLKAFLKKSANERNILLYASLNGSARIQELNDEYLLTRKRRVFRQIITYLMIKLYDDQKFPLVQNCLNAFLSMITDEKIGELIDAEF